MPISAAVRYKSMAALSPLRSSTPRSSTSTLREPPSILLPDVEEEARREELRVEQYGGDDPHEPEPKTRPYALSRPDLREKADPNLVGWDGPDDPENPQNWSNRRKWVLTVLCVVMTINVTFASSAPSAAGGYIVEYFHQPEEVSYAVTSVFLCGYVVGPSFWGPGSELFGRKPLFLGTLICYTLFHLGQALAPNIESLLITRFLSGFFAVSPLTNTGGLIFDIWDPIHRGHGTCLFIAGVFLGPVLGPIVGGFVAQSYLGWRWVFWVMMIFAGVCTLFVFLLPETYAPVLLQKKAQRLRKADPIANAALYAEHERTDWSWRNLIHRTLYRPFEMLMVEPVLLLITLYLSLVYGVIYALFEAVPVIFVETRGFNIGQSGLIFVGVGIGTTLGSVMFLPLSRRYPELMVKWRGFPPPEQRLFGAMIGGPALVIGSFWLGWTGAYPGVPWYVPAMGIIPIGMSVSLVFISFMTFVVDTYLQYTASAFAAMTIVRSMAGAAFPLFTVQMFHKLGIQWACTLIGLLGLLLAPMPFLFYKYGARLRSNSKYAPSTDLLIAEELAAEAAIAAAKLEKPDEHSSCESAV
ncbi:MFS general substrate transporter [Amylocystis lapponica]|nr:MFS general substrate transporter [Amylocystis lapponica]